MGPPPPKVTWSLGARPTSNRNGSANTSSSRFADGVPERDDVARADRLPRSSTSRVAVRRKYETGRAPPQDLLDRRVDQPGIARTGPAARGAPPGSSPSEIALRVVSEPAAARRKKKRSSSCSVSRVGVPSSSTTSACTSADQMSSTGSRRLSSLNCWRTRTASARREAFVEPDAALGIERPEDRVRPFEHRLSLRLRGSR